MFPELEPPGDSPLELLILAGDVVGVMTLIDTMDAAERAVNAVAVARLFYQNHALKRRLALDKQQGTRLFRAIDMARFLCAPDLPLTDYWGHIGIEDIALFKERYQLDPTARLTEKQLYGDNVWQYRNGVHRAVIAGLIERPQTEDYLQSLFFGDLRHVSNIVLRHVDADPGLAPILLGLFDREGPSDASFASAEKYCHDPELYWSHAFLTLCERGVYTRAQLIERTLDALGCDWPQFKSSWFSRFHELLAPTVDEMAAFVPRYLALCHSRIAPTVSLAMDAVAALYHAGRVDQDQVCEAMPPVLASGVKGRVLSALALLGEVVTASPDCAARVAAIAAHALAHPGADVQKKAIARLQAWGLDAAGRDAARGYLPFVSAVNQPALAKLLGEAHPAAPAPVAHEAKTAPARVSALDATRALAPVTELADLVERIAYVLENPDDVDEWERAADALVRMAPIAQGDRAAFLALKKRARRLTWSEHPLGFALARLMACAVDGEATSETMMEVSPEERLAGSTHMFIAARSHDLIAQAARGTGLSPLSTPTHRGGFIDPRVFDARLAAFQQAGIDTSAADRAFARMRLAPASADPVTCVCDWHVANNEPDGSGFDSLETTCQGLVENPGPDDYAALWCVKHATGGFRGREYAASSIRFAASLMPSHLDLFFAEGARAIGDNRDWCEAEWQNRAYLDVLLQPTTAMTPMASLTLGVALAAKEPGQTALAVDALAVSAQDGRLDVGAMGETLARLWATPLAKGARLAKSLAAAARADASMPPVVFALLCAMLAADPEGSRKDMAVLLDLLLELKLAHGLALPASLRATFTGMRPRGKSKVAIQDILA